MDSLSRKLIFGWMTLLVIAGTIAVIGMTRDAFAGELLLAPEVMSELNVVLKVGDALHRSLVIQNEEQTDIGIRDMLVELDRARAMSGLTKPHERRHLLRVLDAARDQFEQTQSLYGEQRLARLEDGFNQLVNIVRIYHVDRAYGIFFCPKDRTTWVQRGMKPQNPFKTESHCGIKVPR